MYEYIYIYVSTYCVYIYTYIYIYIYIHIYIICVCVCVRGCSMHKFLGADLVSATMALPRRDRRRERLDAYVSGKKNDSDFKQRKNDVQHQPSFAWPQKKYEKMSGRFEIAQWPKKNHTHEFGVWHHAPSTTALMSRPTTAMGLGVLATLRACQLKTARCLRLQPFNNGLV